MSYNDTIANSLRKMVNVVASADSHQQLIKTEQIS